MDDLVFAGHAVIPMDVTVDALLPAKTPVVEAPIIVINGVLANLFPTVKPQAATQSSFDGRRRSVLSIRPHY